MLKLNGRVMIRMDSEKRRELERLAAAENRTLSNFIRNVLDRLLTGAKKQK